MVAAKSAAAAPGQAAAAAVPVRHSAVSESDHADGQDWEMMTLSANKDPGL